MIFRVGDGQRRRRRARRQEAAAADAAVLAATPMGAPDRVVDIPVGPGPETGGRLRRTRVCYVCKAGFVQVGGLYHLLCPSCAALNRARRTARADLSGRRALLTGGRVKIGHHVALKMLRDGAHVTVTTRFPRDAARRFAEAGDWPDRLRIVGIDLRDPRQVVALTDHLLRAGEPLDILVNNAAQTLRRPPSVYAALLQEERAGLPAGAWAPPGFSPVPGEHPAVRQEEAPYGLHGGHGDAGRPRRPVQAGPRADRRQAGRRGAADRRSGPPPADGHGRAR
ncbi:SDR family NAD(P)-dependent oxidoreductase [Microtetraspora niveoalba]|uniref:SDR family NAD(P)-dependent oxidoreductase n=1 Tax=Microtetraspora niveoalba TaxID=46175 RepID=UPI001FE1044E|nr:SDR family NAD(P)-dependent oxidoreductase [Microtetraspora niveoalba]